MNSEGGTLRERLYAAAAPPSEPVTIGGMELLMVGLGAADMLAMEEMGDGVDATWWVLERMIRGPDMERVFDDGDPLLRGLPLKLVGELSETAGKLLSLDATAKNSDAVQSSAD